MDESASHSFVFEAAKSGIMTIISVVLNNLNFYNFEINDGDENGNTLLHIISKQGNLEIIEMLINLGSDVDALNNNKETPLHIASSEGNIEVVKLFVARNCNINASNKWKETAVTKAFSNGHIDVVFYFVKLRKLLNKDYKYLLQTAAEIGNLNVLDLCLKIFPDVDMKNTEHLTLLQISVIYERANVVQYLIDEGADVNVLDQNLRNLIHLSVLHKSCNTIIKSLLNKGLNINAKDKYGLTPLHYCVEMNSIYMFDSILMYEPNMNIQDIDGYTALHVAATNNEQIGVLRTLIARGAKTNIKTFNGDTVLHLAASYGNIEVVKLLHGKLDYKLPNINNQTPLSLAKINNHFRVVAFFLKEVKQENIKPKR